VEAAPVQPRRSREMRRDAAAGQRSAVRTARPNQVAIQAAIEQCERTSGHRIGSSVDATTGVITLGFLFPDVAAGRYADAIAAIGTETGVPVTLASEPHQGALAEAAQAALPPGLSPTRAPSIKFALKTVQIRCDGAAEAEALRVAERAFLEQTGWQLEIVSIAPQRTSQAAVVQGGAQAPAPQSLALDTARELFPAYLGCYKIGVDAPAATLTLRFHFPDIAAERLGDRLEQLAAATGWTVKIHPQAHQEALQRAAIEALPAGTALDGRPSLDQERRTLSARAAGPLTPEQVAAAQTAFQERTGWSLALLGPKTVSGDN